MCSLYGLVLKCKGKTVESPASSVVDDLDGNDRWLLCALRLKLEARDFAGGQGKIVILKALITRHKLKASCFAKEAMELPNYLSRPFRCIQGWWQRRHAGELGAISSDERRPEYGLCKISGVLRGGGHSASLAYQHARSC